MQIHIVPLETTYNIGASGDVISFSANARDVATLIHSYCVSTPTIRAYVLIRGPRAITIHRDVADSHEYFSNAMRDLLGSN